MTNQLYGLTRQKFASALLDWGTGTGGHAIHVDLIDMADYTLSINTHEFRSSVPAAARVATFGPLTGKSVALGVLDADDFTFASATGDQAEALIYWRNTGSDATSPVIAFIDVGTGLPVTPNTGDIAVVHNAGGIATV